MCLVYSWKYVKPTNQPKQNKTTHLTPPQKPQKKPNQPFPPKQDKKKKPDPPNCCLGEVQDMCEQYKDKFTSKLL